MSKNPNAHNTSACGPVNRGKKRPISPSASTRAEIAPTAHTARAERANSWSLQRPSSGSMAASNRRAPSSTAPSVASGMPKALA